MATKTIGCITDDVASDCVKCSYGKLFHMVSGKCVRRYVKNADLAAQDQLTPSEMARLGGRVTYFNSDDTAANQGRAAAMATDYNGQVYTGLHHSCDWSRTRWWCKGWHIVNRTGEYAVVTPKE